MPLLLTSPAIPPGGQIPSQYTCSGADISPPLQWSGLPAGTKSLVLVIDDPDAPRGVFRHWAAFDIPPSRPGLPAGYHAGQPAAGFREARNDFGAVGYGGPCPPSGGGMHHYHFTLMAISRPQLALGPAPSVVEVERAARRDAIGEAQLVGTYQR